MSASKLEAVVEDELNRHLDLASRRWMDEARTHTRGKEARISPQRYILYRLRFQDRAKELSIADEVDCHSQCKSIGSINLACDCQISLAR